MYCGVGPGAAPRRSASRRSETRRSKARRSKARRSETRPREGGPVTPATASATVGFWDWSLDPPLVLSIDLAILYWIGARRPVTPARKRTAQRGRDASFYGGLAVLASALPSPIEPLSERLFWVHMIQHTLLIVVAAPLRSEEHTSEL